MKRMWYVGSFGSVTVGRDTEVTDDSEILRKGIKGAKPVEFSDTQAAFLMEHEPANWEEATGVEAAPAADATMDATEEEAGPAEP